VHPIAQLLRSAEKISERSLLYQSIDSLINFFCWTQWLCYWIFIPTFKSSKERQEN